MAFPRGSEWRRWDLHIHTPYTRKNDCFSNSTNSTKSEEEKVKEKWDDFFAYILDYVGDMSDPLKAVYGIGITDYFSIENYKTVIANPDITSKIPNILPNVELRILPAAHEAPINIHCIFNPDLTIDVIENRFLAKLKFRHNNICYSAQKSSLVSLGKSINNSITDEYCAERKAIEQYVVNLTDLQELFNNDKPLRENTIIVISNNSNDGASGVGNPSIDNASSDLTTLREELYKFSDAIFSANPNDVLFFTGMKEGIPAEEIVRKCGKLMSCIHGSDAHQNDKIFEPDQKRYCWIKADPTFNGLKQILYEPEERVKISEIKPQDKPSYQIIKSLTILHPEFQSDPIVFNDKLNCIIGGKSTGKSILLHNLARAIDIKQVEEKCEVSSNKGKSDKKNKPLTFELDPIVLSVNWLDDGDSNGRKVVYIPQTYLNRLADSAQETTEIDEIIEKVLLDRVDRDGKLLIESKRSLKTKVDSIKSENTSRLLEIIRRYDQIRKISDEIAEIGGKAFVKKELQMLRQQREELSQKLKLNEDDINSYDKAVGNVEFQTKIIGRLGQEIAQIGKISVVVQRSSDLIGFSEDAMLDVHILVDSIISKANDSWNTQKTAIVEKWTTMLDVCKKSLDESEKTRDSLKDIIESNNTIKDLAKKISIESEKLENIEALEKSRKVEQVQYDELLAAIASSYVNVRTDYDLFAEYVNQNTHNDSSDLSFAVQIPFRQEDFSAKWAEVYGIKSKISRELVDAEAFTSEQYTSDFIKSIIMKTLSGEIIPLKNSSKEQSLRNILDDWYNIKYMVKMGNDTIEKMSPGKKALVLLKLLIEMADSKCPILIDQPEDDLDNRSIYEQLIPFIKRKKIDRQIIVVTHNANIVVGADAEEVIVANQEGQDAKNKAKRFEYRSGSIENNIPVILADNQFDKVTILGSCGIQKHICDILEGGEKAFELRKHKYHI